MTKVRNLKHRNEDGAEEVFFPKTSTRAVYNTEGVLLDDTLNAAFANIYLHSIVPFSGIIASATIDLNSATEQDGDIYYIADKKKFAFRPRGSARLFSNWTVYPQPFYFYPNGNYFSEAYKKIYLDALHKKQYYFDGLTLNEL